jgi:L-aspartate oxidase
MAATASIRPRRPRLVSDGGADRSDPAPVRPILSRAAGVLRDGEGLRAAARSLYPLATSHHAASDPAMVGLMIVIAALRRQESRGAHGRTDFPDHANPARRSTLRLDDALQTARDYAAEPVA